MVKFSEKVEQCGKWPQEACTFFFEKKKKNATSERPNALLPTLVWWDWLRALESKKGTALEWDATDGRNGGAERIAETLLEMKFFDYTAGQMDQGAITLVLDLAKALGRCVGVGDALQCHQEDLAGAMWLFQAPTTESV